MKPKKLYISFDLDVGVTDDDKLKKSSLKAEIKDCIKDRLWQFYGWVKINNLNISEQKKEMNKYWICIRLKTGPCGVEYKPGEVIDYTPPIMEQGLYFREATEEEINGYLKSKK